MASRVSKMSPAQLQNLRLDKRRITILYRPGSSISNDDLCVVFSDYSESVARHLSAFCIVNLPAKPKIGAMADLTRPQKPSIVVRQDNYKSVCKVFKYMNDFCGGNERLPELGDLPLLGHFKFLDLAISLGVHVLIENVDNKIAELAKNVPKLEDVLAVLDSYPPGSNPHPRAIVAECLADALFHGLVSAASDGMTLIRLKDAAFSTTVDTLVLVKQAVKAQADAAKALENEKKKQDQEAKRKAHKEQCRLAGIAAEKARRENLKAARTAERTKSLERAEEVRLDKIAKAAGVPLKRVDTSKPSSVFLRPKRGGEVKDSNKAGPKNSGDRGQEMVERKPVPIEIVLPGKSIKIEDAGAGKAD